MLIKRLSYIVCLLFCVNQVLHAQTATFNNHWINYSQPYYKIKISADGLYRLDSASLAAAGVPITTVNPQNIQLFQKGKEIFP